MATVRMAEGDTFAKILEWNAANRGKRPAIREKHLGISIDIWVPIVLVCEQTDTEQVA